MYLTYTEYTAYGGTLTEASFNSYEYEAESIINWYTFNRLSNETTYSEAVKRCMYALIGLVELKHNLLMGSFGGESSGTNTGTSSIKSQANDGVSVSYNTLTADDYMSKFDLTSRGNEFENTVRLYLNNIKDSQGRNLLYRGLYPGE